MPDIINCVEIKKGNTYEIKIKTNEEESNDGIIYSLTSKDYISIFDREIIDANNIANTWVTIEKDDGTAIDFLVKIIEL